MAFESYMYLPPGRYELMFKGVTYTFTGQFWNFSHNGFIIFHQYWPYSNKEGRDRYDLKIGSSAKFGVAISEKYGERFGRQYIKEYTTWEGAPEEVKLVPCPNCGMLSDVVYRDPCESCMAREALDKDVIWSLDHDRGLCDLLHYVAVRDRYTARALKDSLERLIYSGGISKYRTDLVEFAMSPRKESMHEKLASNSTRKE